jgi:predicted dehydrogenase
VSTSSTGTNSVSLTRRSFLGSAVGAGLALSATHPAQARRSITASSLIRVGLIGSDGHRNVLLDSIPHLTGVEWSAYAKGQPGEDTAWVPKLFPGSQKTRVYASYQEMLEKEPLDVVGVCLPFFQNAEASIQAARRGIHVFSEKPGATTLADLDRLEREVQHAGVRYSIMLTMRGMPIFQAAQQAVSAGAIGEPILLSSQKSYKWGSSRPWYYNKRETYGDSIAWIGIHAVDYMRWVSGKEYARVAAFEGNKAHPASGHCEDYGALLFSLAGGGTATCHLDYLRPETAPTHGDARLRIAGSEGVLEVTEVGDRANLISAKGKVGDLPLPPPLDLFTTFIAELRGQGAHILSQADAFAIPRICLKARDAADSGNWVNL